MFKSRYLLKISGKNPYRFLLSLRKQGVEFLKIIEDIDYYVLVNEKDYHYMMKLKTIYHITLVKIEGFKYYLELFKKKKIFFLCLFLGIFLIYFLSNIIFQVEVIHTNKDIRDLVLSELKLLGIDKYQFCVSFSEKERIRSIILEKEKDVLEWMEIERVGTKYIIRVEERKIKEESESSSIRDIVAKKDGIITRIEASRGSIVVKKNQYVKKGDILITGVIKNNDEVKDLVVAEGEVFAETWYKVQVSMPFHYYEEKLTGEEHKVLRISFLGKKFSFFDFKPYKDKKSIEKVLLSYKLFPFTLSLDTDMELFIKDVTYTKEELVEMAREEAKKKVMESIGVKNRIIHQKDLKIIEEDSKIVVEVFLKVEEDITDYQNIVLEDET